MNRSLRNKSEEFRKAYLLEKRIADKYFSERFVALLPALRAASAELKLSRGEILLLLAAKTFQRKHKTSFTAKSIEAYTYISYKNLNTALTNLCDKSFLKVDLRGGRFSAIATLFSLSYEGLQAVNRFDDLAMAFTFELSQK